MAAYRKYLVPLAVILGVALIVVGIVYFAEPAKALPSFFPGHVGASDPEAARHHAKHGIAAVFVGLAFFAFAWFNTGPKKRTA